MAAFMDLAASGGIRPASLITHRFGFEKAPEAYGLLSGKTEPH